MELTGKCKVDFEKWYFIEYCKSSIKYNDLMPHHKLEIFGWFDDLRDSFKYGVYVDFFDSLDVFIYVLCWETEDGDFYFNYEIIGFWGNHSEYGRYETRHEARTKAIEKANEIYNGN